MSKDAYKLGLKDKEPVAQKKPREETTGQRPKARSFTVKGEQGTVKGK